MPEEPEPFSVGLRLPPKVTERRSFWVTLKSNRIVSSLSSFLLTEREFSNPPAAVGINPAAIYFCATALIFVGSIIAHAALEGSPWKKLLAWRKAATFGSAFGQLPGAPPLEKSPVICCGVNVCIPLVD